jgi:hypothetical protein
MWDSGRPARPRRGKCHPKPVFDGQISTGDAQADRSSTPSLGLSILLWLAGYRLLPQYPRYLNICRRSTCLAQSSACTFLPSEATTRLPHKAIFRPSNRVQPALRAYRKSPVPPFIYNDSRSTYSLCITRLNLGQEVHTLSINRQSAI